MIAPEARSSAAPGPAFAGAATTGTAAPETNRSADEREEPDHRLIRATKDNDVELVPKLIAAGADIYAKEVLGDSALPYAGAERFNQILGLSLETERTWRA